MDVIFNCRIYNCLGSKLMTESFVKSQGHDESVVVSTIMNLEYTVLNLDSLL